MKRFLPGETASTRRPRYEETAVLPLGGNERFLQVGSAMGLPPPRSLPQAALAGPSSHRPRSPRCRDPGRARCRAVVPSSPRPPCWPLAVRTGRSPRLRDRGRARCRAVLVAPPSHRPRLLRRVAQAGMAARCSQAAPLLPRSRRRCPSRSTLAHATLHDELHAW